MWILGVEIRVELRFLIAKRGQSGSLLLLCELQRPRHKTASLSMFLLEEGEREDRAHYLHRLGLKPSLCFPFSPTIIPCEFIKFLICLLTSIEHQPWEFLDTHRSCALHRSTLICSPQVLLNTWFHMTIKYLTLTNDITSQSCFGASCIEVNGRCTEKCEEMPPQNERTHFRLHFIFHLSTCWLFLSFVQERLLAVYSWHQSQIGWC